MKLRDNYSDLLKILAVAVALLAVPFLTTKTYIVHDFTIFMLFLAIVVYWNLVFGYGGILSLGQTAIFGVGGYGAAIAMKFGGMPIGAALLIATLLAGIFGFIVGLACLRLRGAYVAFITLAIMVALASVIQTDMTCMFKQEFTCSSLTGGPMGLSRFGKLDGIDLPGPLKFSYVVALLNVVIAMLFALFVVHGVLGKALVAIRDSEKLAAARGINRVRVHTLLFAATSALTGLTGGIYVAYNGTVGPTMFDFSTLTLLLTMMIVGGMGRLHGPVLGAALIYGLDFWFKDFGEWRSMLLGLVTIGAVLLLPGGISQMFANVRERFLGQAQEQSR